MWWLADENVARGWQEPNLVFPVGAVVPYSPSQGSQQLHSSRLAQMWASTMHTS